MQCNTEGRLLEPAAGPAPPVMPGRLIALSGYARRHREAGRPPGMRRNRAFTCSYFGPAAPGTRQRSHDLGIGLASGQAVAAVLTSLVLTLGTVANYVQHGGTPEDPSDWTVMDTYPHEAWQRLGRALERRRGELGYGFRQRGRFSRERGGGRISIKTISRLEKGERSSYPQSTVGAVETIYRWAPGSVEAVLRGGDPDPLAVRPGRRGRAGATPSPPSTPRPRPASGSPAGCTCACVNSAAR